MKLLSNILGIVIVLLALAFALANRQTVAVSLWPFGLEISAPLGLFALGCLFLGLLAGALIAWLSLLPNRWEVRRLRKDIAGLQGKVDHLQQTVLPPDVEDKAGLLPPPASKWRFRENRS